MSLSGAGFSEGQSPLHAAEQRMKILSALALTLVTATVHTMAAAGLGVATGLLLAAIARLPLRKLVLALLSANSFFLFLFVTLPLTYPGEPWPLFPLVSLNGVRLALLITVKGNAVLLLVFALVATNTPQALAHGLYRLGLPHKLVLLLSFVYRQAFLSLREVQRMRMAAEMRCFESRLSCRTFKTYAYIVAQALLRSLDRAERIHHAMLMRGFDGRFHCLFPVPAICRKDVFLFSSALTVALLILCVDQGWLT